MTDLPAPMTPPGCDVSDIPFPHALLVKLARDAFGLSEEQVTDLAVSLGMTRVGGGWVQGVAGNG